MKPVEFARLHEQCSAALKNFVIGANRTCELLGGCKPEKSPPLEQRNTILRQRSRENTAYFRYSDIRGRLLAAASGGRAGGLE